MLKKLLLAALGALAACTAQAESFKFVALGDMPYGEPSVDFPRYEALIDTINARAPAFTIHLGDTKSGKTPCSDQALLEQRDFMNRFKGALVYTPGDNEWTDCHRTAAGGYDPRERLAFIRQNYFTAARSLGQTPMPLQRQADLMPEFARFVENARFSRGGIVFVTAHVVGSNNGFEVHDPQAATEFFERNRANIAWLNTAFDTATRENAKGLVLAMQANMFEFDFNEFGKERHLRHSGFKTFAETLVARVEAFARPVLLVYGDSHIFRVYRPYRRKLQNLLAVEVFGAPNIDAVEITVDTEDPALWSIRPIYNPLPPAD